MTFFKKADFQKRYHQVTCELFHLDEFLPSVLTQLILEYLYDGTFQSTWHQYLLNISRLENLLPPVLSQIVLNYLCYDCSYSIAAPGTFLPKSYNRMTWDSPLASGFCPIKGANITLKPLCAKDWIVSWGGIPRTGVPLRTIDIFQPRRDLEMTNHDSWLSYQAHGSNQSIHVDFTSIEMFDLLQEQQEFLSEEAGRWGMVG